jgi:hypothetical protein
VAHLEPLQRLLSSKVATDSKWLRHQTLAWDHHRWALTKVQGLTDQELKHSDPVLLLLKLHRTPTACHPWVLLLDSLRWAA